MLLLFWPLFVTGQAIFDARSFRANFTSFFSGFSLWDLHLYVACLVLGVTSVILVCGLFAMGVRWMIEGTPQPEAEEAGGGDGTAGARGEEPAGLG